MKKIILTVVAIVIGVVLLAAVFNAEGLRQWLITENTTSIETVIV